MYLEQTTIVVDDQDEAIAFFVDVLGFELVTDEPSTTNDGRPKRWIVVRPPGAMTALLVARADGDRQHAAIGNQFGGRVGFFLRVDDFDAALARLRDADVEIIGEPRDEAYGRVVVFVDLVGNRWDLLGPHPEVVEESANDAESDAGSDTGSEAGSGTGSRILVRRERGEDEPASRAVQVAAFDDGTGEPVEGALLDGLRRCDGWLPALSWVAEREGEIVGHNVATRAFVDGEDGSAVACVGLGPIGVRPDLQAEGIGSRLMAAMIGAADATGEPLIGLLGSPDYYRRFGFVASTEVGIVAPDPLWGPYFQVLPLSAWAPSIAGRFRYAEPFDTV